MKGFLCSVYIVFSCFFVACHGQVNEQPHCEVSFLKPKRYETFRFRIDNNDMNSMGYKTLAEGDTYSISSVLVHKQYAYLTDEIHGNVKRINLTTGELYASKLIDKDSSWLEIITNFNDSFYILTTTGLFYRLDSLLNTQGTFFISDYFGRKKIFSQTNDSLVVFIDPSDVKQGKDLMVKIRRCIIKRDNTFSFDSISIGKGYNKFHELINTTRRGRKFKFEENNNMHFLITNKNQYELGREIEKLKNYACENFDFNEKFIVWYNFTEEELTLHVLEY